MELLTCTAQPVPTSSPSQFTAMPSSWLSDKNKPTKSIGTVLHSSQRSQPICASALLYWLQGERPEVTEGGGQPSGRTGEGASHLTGPQKPLIPPGEERQGGTGSPHLRPLPSPGKVHSGTRGSRTLMEGPWKEGELEKSKGQDKTD